MLPSNDYGNSNERFDSLPGGSAACRSEYFPIRSLSPMSAPRKMLAQQRIVFKCAEVNRLSVPPRLPVLELRGHAAAVCVRQVDSPPDMMDVKSSSSSEVPDPEESDGSLCATVGVLCVFVCLSVCLTVCLATLKHWGAPSRHTPRLRAGVCPATLES